MWIPKCRWEVTVVTYVFCGAVLLRFTGRFRYLGVSIIDMVFILVWNVCYWWCCCLASNKAHPNSCCSLAVTSLSGVLLFFANWGACCWTGSTFVFHILDEVGVSCWFVFVIWRNPKCLVGLFLDCLQTLSRFHIEHQQSGFHWWWPVGLVSCLTATPALFCMAVICNDAATVVFYILNSVIKTYNSNVRSLELELQYLLSHDYACLNLHVECPL